MLNGHAKTLSHAHSSNILMADIDFNIPILPLKIDLFFKENGAQGIIGPNIFIEYYYTHIITSFLSRDYKYCLKMFSILKKYIWEKIYSKNYSDVDIEWFQLYSVVLFIHGYILYKNQDWRESLTELDNAILIGAPIYGNLLHRLIEHIKIQYACQINSRVKVSENKIFHLISMPIDMKYKLKIPRKRLTLSEFLTDYYQKTPAHSSLQAAN
ncbi:hypothetical protein HZS_647 [Henneguya salminicola]|nr:hypothetical protein HZS_647 [Henneguya salminicola]